MNDLKSLKTFMDIYKCSWAETVSLDDYVQVSRLMLFVIL